ncbi:uncharacterized protein LOC134275769, partial [Saccostrea cucullata]|uniref:uncharacterized protein LOC134236186 n=1 Tax=Saccostrea cuccullata TaxID=36930 RepID=UPI002ED1E3A0
VKEIARGKKSYLSSTLANYKPAVCNNGNLNDFCHTKIDATPWYRIDLGARYDVDEVRIFNRRRCCGNRFRDAVIQVGDSIGSLKTCGTFKGPGKTGQMMKIKCPGGMKGRWVQIVQKYRSAMNLADVQVFGTKSASQAPKPTTTVNRADMLGCYQDSKKRVLSGPPTLSKHMTVGFCRQNCERRNKRFYGLQHANECWCGNTMQSKISKPMKECMMKCKGSNEACGGPWRLLIYRNPKYRSSDMLGCYQDSKRRVLSGPPTLSKHMTVGFCRQNCERRNKRFYGLQHANECWCGNTMQSKISKPMKECMMKCKGSNEACGGPWRLLIYRNPKYRSSAVKEVARGKKSYLSSTLAHYKPAVCNNGNLNDFCHTKIDATPWYRIDLGARYDVDEVRIFNRRRCCGNRFRDALIQVGDSLGSLKTCGTFKGPGKTGQMIKIKCPGGMRGRWVQITQRYRSAMNLADVQVFASKSASQVVKPAVVKELARGKKSFLSSTLAHFKPAVCNNGNLNDFCHTKIDATPWYRIDLGKSYSVDEVRIFNRRNCCGNRFRNAVILVGETLGSLKTCGTFKGPGKTGQMIKIKCPGGMTGRWVQILQKYRSAMNLADVQVFGS